MELKQISLTLPENLFHAAKKYYEEFGYRNLQEFILDLLRKRVVMENLEQYYKIEARMKKGVGIKRFSQKGAAQYLRGL